MKNGYNDEDEVVFDSLRKECLSLRILKKITCKCSVKSLPTLPTDQKTYWKILNKLLNKCKVPRIPPLFVHNTFITICKEKASIFNKFFISQCTPLLNDSALTVESGILK